MICLLSQKKEKKDTESETRRLKKREKEINGVTQPCKSGFKIIVNSMKHGTYV